MVFTFRAQPLRTLYLVVRIPVLLFLQLPFYALLYALPSFRPCRSWPFSRSMIVVAYRAFINIMYDTSYMTFVPSPDPEKVQNESGFVWVDPVPEYFTGEGEVQQAARINGVKPAKTWGFWYPHNRELGQKTGDNEKVIYHFHGGGSIMGTPHPSNDNLKTLSLGLHEHLPSHPRLFALSYRLSSAAPFPAANPFPAALFDALAGYHYLVHTLNFRPENIILSGDSAGGLVAFWLARYLALHTFPQLPNPGGLLLLSPTVDWAVTQMGEESSMRRNAASDFVDTILMSGYTRRALLGALPEAEAAVNAWIAPGSALLPYSRGMFKGLPKTCFVTGGAEQTLDAMETLRDRLLMDLGEENVSYMEAKDGTHDFLTFAWHEPERTEALQLVAGWVRDSIWPDAQ